MAAGAHGSGAASASPASLSSSTSSKHPSRLELSITCAGLSPVARLRSRVAAQVGVYQQKLHGGGIRSRRSVEAPWVAIGQTEVVTAPSPAAPSFLQRVPVEYFFEEVQPLRLDVYDHDQDGGKNMEAQTYLGSASLTLAEIVASPKRELTKPLTRGGATPTTQSGTLKRAGTITIVAHEVEDAKLSVTLQLSARGLTLHDLIGHTDPNTYLRVCRSAEGEWAAIHRTEMVEQSSVPGWRPFTLPVQQLNRGEVDRPIRFEVWHWAKSGKEELLGAMQATITQLQERRDWTLSHGNRKRRKEEAFLNIVNCEIHQAHTFLDYIAGGTDIQLMCAIDFTASNGDPSYPSSLHFRSQEGNEYTRALTAVADILLKYDSDQKVPVYGFGAKRQPSEPVSHCFALESGADGRGEVNGMRGMLHAYNAALSRLTFFGPTMFAPIVRQAAALAGSSISQTEQRYLILLIVTDGEIADFDATVAALVDASSCPLSIVIVGVGDADFTNMRGLDSDEALLSYKGRVAERDVVQFVAFRDYKETHTSRLAADVLAEIPTQFLSYMKARNILPGNGRKAQVGAAAPSLAATPSVYGASVQIQPLLASPTAYPYVPLLEVAHDFVAAGPDQLSVRVGDTLVWLYAPNADWTYARLVAGSQAQGYVPSAYVRPKAP